MYTSCNIHLADKEQSNRLICYSKFCARCHIALASVFISFSSNWIQYTNTHTHREIQRKRHTQFICKRINIPRVFAHFAGFRFICCYTLVFFSHLFCCLSSDLSMCASLCSFFPFSLSFADNDDGQIMRIHTLYILAHTTIYVRKLKWHIPRNKVLSKPNLPHRK